MIPGHREPQQLAEQKRPRVVAGQAKRQERGGRWELPWGFVCPYHEGGVATLVLQLQKRVQFLLAPQ